jgi:hypothetical protein
MSKLLQIGRRAFLESGLAALGGTTILASGLSAETSKSSSASTEGSVSSGTALDSGSLPAWCPQPYTITRDERQGKLILSTPYYTVEHDLKKGGAITKIGYTFGKAENLLLQPLAASVQVRGDEPAGQMRGNERRQKVFTDVADSSASVSTAKTGKGELVTTQGRLLNPDGGDSGMVTSTSYTYRWGYIKIHKEIHFPPQGLKIRRLSVLSTLLHPSFTHYGYNPNPAEAFSSEVLQNGSCFWGKIRPGTQFDVPFETRYIPRYLVWANPGVEGIEWFASDALAQWDYQVAGQPGAGYAALHASVDPPGVAVSIDPLNVSPTFLLPKGGYVTAADSFSFDYYLGIPILDGQGHNPWLERSFNPQGGNWVPEEQIKHNAALGVGTMTLHDDGDVNHDGLYWHDGDWPPYPPEQMKKMAEVIEICHQQGIKTVPYFSNHELHQTTKEFKEHGEEWGNKPDDQGTLRPNYNYGPLMCLKSGWLDYFKLCVDRALKNYPFDGVYYDWNQALYCNNSLHVGKATNGVSGARGLASLALSSTGHWDVDELLELMEWTRERVGPKGLILVHNSMNPMLAVENFVNAICTMEWGYGRVSTAMPRPEDLPLEWNMVGARARAVIEYGSTAPRAPAQVRQQFYLTALITGVATWPASDGALELFKLLKPLGDLGQYRFEDWRNKAVSLGHPDCYSAVYSHPEEAGIVLANLGAAPAKVNCLVNLGAFSHPLASVGAATLTSEGKTSSLDPAALAGAGQEITIPAASASLIRLRRA